MSGHNDYRVQLDMIRDRLEADYFHGKIRSEAPLMFNKLLDQCDANGCPDLSHDYYRMHCLNDLSLEHYILVTAYFMPYDEIQDQKGRYFAALNRIKAVLY